MRVGVDLQPAAATRRPSGPPSRSPAAARAAPATRRATRRRPARPRRCRPPSAAWRRAPAPASPRRAPRWRRSGCACAASTTSRRRPSARSASSPTSSWASSTTSSADLGARRRGHAPRPGDVGDPRPLGVARRRRDVELEALPRSARGSPRGAGRTTSPSPLGPPSQTRWRAVRSRPPAAAARPSHHRPVTVANVVGTACWPSVRAIIGVVPARALEVDGDVATPRRSSAADGVGAAPHDERASRRRRCPGWSPPRWTSAGVARARRSPAAGAAAGSRGCRRAPPRRRSASTSIAGDVARRGDRRRPPPAGCRRRRPGRRRAPPRPRAAPRPTPAPTSARRPVRRRSRKRNGSDDEEDGLIVAPAQADVEAPRRRRPAVGRAARPARSPASREHRVGGVGRVAVEVGAGDDAVEQAAGEHRHGEVRAPAAVPSSVATAGGRRVRTAHAPSASGRAAGERAAVLPRLDDGVGHRRRRRRRRTVPRSVDRVGVVGGDRVASAGSARARWRNGPTVCDGVSSATRPGSSNGVAAGPRTTMSKRKPSAHSGSVTSWS